MNVEDYFRFAAALLIVIALIALVAWILRRLGLAAGSGGGRQGRRLGVIESLALDPRHRLMLVRRDEREHLILIGHQGALLLEAGADRVSTQPVAQAVPQTGGQDD